MRNFSVGLGVLILDKLQFYIRYLGLDFIEKMTLDQIL